MFRVPVSLAARIMWRLDKEGGVMSDMQMTSLDDLENHISDMPEDDLKELKVDIHNFLDYWPRNSKQHRVDDISHIFGVVGSSLFSFFSPFLPVSLPVSSYSITFLFSSVHLFLSIHL